MVDLDTSTDIEAVTDGGDNVTDEKVCYFEYRAYSRHPHIKDQADHLLGEMLQGRQRQPNSRKRAKYRRSMIHALAGLQLAGAYALVHVRIPLTKNYYVGKGRRSPLYRPELYECLTWLIDDGYLHKTLNHSYSTEPGDGHPAAYQLTRKWLDMAVLYPPAPMRSIEARRGLDDVVLKDTKKQRLPLPDSPEVTEYQARVRRYNRKLSSHRFELDGEELSPATFSVQRIFNNGTLKHGGRYFSSFTNWRKLDRLRLKVDGEGVVEVDFRSLYPALLYQMAGGECSDDPYDIPGYERDLVKRAFNVLINSSGKKDLDLSLYRELKMGERGAAKDLLGKLLELHRPVAHFFGTSKGMELQRHESELLSKIIDYLDEHHRDVMLLPVHDSFVVKGSSTPALVRALYFAEQWMAQSTGLDVRSPSVTIKYLVEGDVFTEFHQLGIDPAMPLGHDPTDWMDDELEIL